MPVAVDDLFDFGKATATLNVAIRKVVPPRRGRKARLGRFSYTPAGTSHTLTVMRVLDKTTVVADALASQAVFRIASVLGSGLIPANTITDADLVLIEGPVQGGQRTYVLGVVNTGGIAAVAGSTVQKDVTLTANLPTGGVKKGAQVWFLGVEGDGHPQYALPTGSTTTLSDPDLGVAGSALPGEPIVLSIDNITAAGTLNNATAFYAVTGGHVDPSQGLRGEVGGGEDAMPPLVLVALPEDDWVKAHYDMDSDEFDEDKVSLPSWDGFDEGPMKEVPDDEGQDNTDAEDAGAGGQAGDETQITTAAAWAKAHEGVQPAAKAEKATRPGKGASKK
jgi:hypothetical protein